MWLDESRAIKAHGQSPDEVQGGLVLHVKQLQNHGAACSQGRETGQSFGDQEALDRVFLTVEVGTEVEPAIGRIHVGFATCEMGLCCRSEGILVCQVVQIPRIVGTVCDMDLGVTLEKGLGLTPTGHGAFGRLQCHGDHGNRC